MSLRLETLAGYYHHSPIVYDIGCDHGQLGLSFIHEEKIEEIHLVDPSLDVIQVLKTKLIDSHIPQKDLIHVHHKKGQDLILREECKTIFIAGMGGKEILEILDALIPQLTEADRVVISPHRNILELRKFLNTSPLRLWDECSLKEGTQFYQILCLIKSSKLPSVHPFGEKIWEGEMGEEYRKHQAASFSVHQTPLAQEFVAYLRQVNS